MVLADGEDPSPGAVELEVGVAQVAGAGVGRDRFRGPGHRVGDAVQPAVEEVREDDQVARGEVRAAAVLVDAGAHVDARRADVRGRAVGRAPDEHLDPALGGPSLEPVDQVTVEVRFADPDDARGEEIDRQR